MYPTTTIPVMSQEMISQPTSTLLSFLLPWTLHRVRRVEWTPWAQLVKVPTQLLKLLLRHPPPLLPPMMHPPLPLRKQSRKRKGAGKKRRLEAFNFV